jgi:EF hand
MNLTIPLTEKMALVAMFFLAGLLAWNQPASAQEESEFIALYFNRLDQNRDGAFSLDDLLRQSAKEFKRTDDDRDGVLVRDEFLFGIPAEQTDAIDYFNLRFENSDRDGDGTITLVEDRDYCARLVAALDTNGDGLVQRAEFLAGALLPLP